MLSPVSKFGHQVDVIMLQNYAVELEFSCDVIPWDQVSIRKLLER